MESLSDSSVGLPSLFAYGLLILLYLIILKLLLNLLQRLGKERYHKSVVDREIHATMTNRVETSMHAFDVYDIALIIAKAGIATIAMAAIIVLLVIKVGVLATALLIIITVTVLYAVSTWLKSQEKPGTMRAEVRKYIRKTGGVGTVIILSLALVLLLFGMTFIGV